MSLAWGYSIKLKFSYFPCHPVGGAQEGSWTCYRQGEVKIAQLCLTLWPHGLFSPCNSSGQNTGMGSLSLLQRPTQGSYPGLKQGKVATFECNVNTQKTEVSFFFSALKILWYRFVIIHGEKINPKYIIIIFHYPGWRMTQPKLSKCFCFVFSVKIAIITCPIIYNYWSAFFF